MRDERRSGISRHPRSQPLAGWSFGVVSYCCGRSLTEPCRRPKVSMIANLPANLPASGLA
jgi:hypothetical protein